MRPGCNGEHAVGAHRLLGESDVCVNLATGGDYESEEEEEWWVNTVRAGEEEEENLEETEENGKREVRYFTSTYMRKDDSGLEDELGYFWEAPIPSDSGEQEEDRWWSPGPQEPSSKEDEEEVRYLTNLLELGPKENETEEGDPFPSTRGAASTNGGSQLPSPERPTKKKGGLPETIEGTEPPPAKKFKRRRLRKKVTEDENHGWEVARQDAWLRELLTDSSGSDTEEKYSRFAESGRWVAEMTGIRDKECMGVQREGIEAKALQQQRRPHEGSVPDHEKPGS
jgi:hypothetical protein